MEKVVALNETIENSTRMSEQNVSETSSKPLCLNKQAGDFTFGLGPMDPILEPSRTTGNEQLGADRPGPAYHSNAFTNTAPSTTGISSLPVKAKIPPISPGKMKPMSPTSHGKGIKTSNSPGKEKTLPASLPEKARYRDTNKLTVPAKQSKKSACKSPESAKNRPAWQTWEPKVKIETEETYSLAKYWTNRHEDPNRKEFKTLRDAKMYFRNVKSEYHTKTSSHHPPDDSVDPKYHQVGTSFSDDAFYHFVNINDYDDTRPARKNLAVKIPKQKTHPRQRLYSLKNGVPRYVPRSTELDEDEVAELCSVKHLREYFIKEIERGKKVIRCCCVPNCVDTFEPFYVVKLVGTEQAREWYRKNYVDGRRLSHGDREVKVYPRNEKEASKSYEEDVLIETNEKKKTKWKRWRAYGRGEKAMASDVKPEEESGKSEETPRNKCVICYEGPNYLMQCQKCKQYVCTPCLKAHLVERLHQQDVSPQCPNCDQEYGATFVLQHLDDKSLQELYLSKSLELYLIRNKETRRCPGSGCNFAVLNPGGRCPIECQNPGCGIKFCSDCEHKWGDLAMLTPHECEDMMVEEDWFKGAVNVKPCPGCGFLIEKLDDGSCNEVLCKYCRVYFCWICGEVINGLHIFTCPLYGNKKFGLRRRILNYVGTGVGVLVGVPVVASLVLGAGLTITAGVVTAGVLGSPALLAKQVYEHERRLQSSATRRWLAVSGGIGLGLVGMPLLSLWGVYRAAKGLRAGFTALDRKLASFLEAEEAAAEKRRKLGEDEDIPDDEPLSCEGVRIELMLDPREIENVFDSDSGIVQ